MRVRLAWGGMILLIALASPARSEPSTMRLQPIDAPVEQARLALPGVELDGGGRLGLGFYESSVKRPVQASVRDAMSPPRQKKSPGVGLTLKF